MDQEMQLPSPEILAEYRRLRNIYNQAHGKNPGSPQANRAEEALLAFATKNGLSDGGHMPTDENGDPV